MKRCIKCNDPLVIGDNTSQSMFKRYDYKCLPCRRVLDKPYEQARERIRPPDLERKRLWKKNNKAYVRADVAKRRAVKETRNVSWADEYKIKKFYAMAAWLNEVNGPNTWHVDHIIPLMGEFVSGLHTHDNLQILTANQNIMKSNNFDLKLQK